MPYSIKKRLRTPVLSTLMLLLFAVSSLFVSISAAYRIHVEQNIKETEKQFTAIAILQPGEPFNSSIDLEEEFRGNLSLLDQYRRKKPVLLQKMLALYNLVETSENAVPDNREIFRGVCPSVWPVLSHHLIRWDNLPYSQAVLLAVTCQNVTYLTMEEVMQMCGSANISDLQYKVEFTVDEAIVLHPDYNQKTISFIGGYYDKNGNVPFTPGRRYVVSGYFVKVRTEMHGLHPGEYVLQAMTHHVFPRVALSGNVKIYPDPEEKEITYNGEKYSIWTFHDNTLYGIRAPLNSDMDTFWVENPNWADYRIKYLETNAHSLYVLTTDNIQSLPYFNQKKAWIVQGRGFTEDELAGEVQACLISEKLAAYNNLSVGDTLPLYLYEPQLEFNLKTYDDSIGSTNDKDLRGFVMPNIVGIFSGPDEPFGYSAYGLSVNTVIIPSRLITEPDRNKPYPPSVEAIFDFPVQLDENGSPIIDPREKLVNRARYNSLLQSSILYPDQFTAIIQPEKLKAFQKEAEKAGLSKYLLYHDQGFSALLQPIARLRASANMFAMLSAAVWAVLLAVLVILTRRERHEMGLMLTAGVKRGRAAAGMVAGWLALLLPALVLSGLLATAFFGGFTRAVLGNLLAGRDFSDTYSVGIMANSEVTAAELFAGMLNVSLPQTVLWIIILAQAVVYILILTARFGLMAFGKPRKLLRRRE